MSENPYKTVPPFKNRWLIKGTFTTKSELHIGDGHAISIQDRERPGQKDSTPSQDHQSDASTVCVDHRGVAYIPGSSIKGPLRALVSSVDPTTQKSRIHRDWESLLGSDSPDDPESVGGKLEFWDAFHASGKGNKEEAFMSQPRDCKELVADRKRPWWDNQRKTCVAVAVSLDRRTRTAKENLLYHLEYVPVGETFKFEISGDNLELKDIARILVLLDQFNVNGSATLGALSSNGWGRVACEVKPNDVQCFDAGNSQDLTQWKKCPKPGLASCKSVSAETYQKILLEKKSIAPPQLAKILSIDLRLTFESPWLIRDPRQSGRVAAAKRKEFPEIDKPSDGAPILDESGNPFVPAKSLRGALRSRAEMILRTLGLECADHPSDKSQVVSSAQRSLEDSLKDVREKDLAARLFGCSGWRGTLEVPRLTLIDPSTLPTPHHQEFVAIDRFTGGAAGGAKFNADLAGGTSLGGTLLVDLSRLALVDKKRCALGLLALVLRDLAEGDIPLGSGSSKGQGLCCASAIVTESGKSPQSLTDWFENSTLLADALAAFHAEVEDRARAASDSRLSVAII